ncbi:MAG TPA: porin, partial [Candidatus Dormibacteraeota bacterium]|nr:porin [Candidatus Dormibacteraeota bacterium]
MTPIRTQSHARVRPFRGPVQAVAAGMLAVMAAAAALAQTPAAPSDSLTWNGITLYGIVDVGVQYQTHGVPASDYFPAGTEAIIQKNSNGSVTAVTPNNWSQSRIGFSGNEPLVGDWAGVFRLETFFNPQSGDLSDALKSLVLNNGRALTSQTTNVDSSVAGQLFAGAAYAGFSSKSIGTFTFGRHVTPLADGISKYDPMSASQAFSLIGFSGTTAGGGDTEDRRLDQSVKYTGKYGPVHLGALYQFSGASGSTNTAVQLTGGAEFGGFSADAFYAKKYDAVAAAALSAAQVEGDPKAKPPVAGLAALCNPPAPVPPAKATPPLCISANNALAGTISDNTTWAIMGSYSFETLKLSAGYENITFKNPSNPLEAGTAIIGGYQLAYVNNTNFGKDKTLEVFWAGLKYTVMPQFDLLAAYYGYRQNSYATGADAGCSSAAISGKCSGTESSFSVVADYRFSKRFDGYLGTFY